MSEDDMVEEIVAVGSAFPDDEDFLTLPSEFQVYDGVEFTPTGMSGQARWSGCCGSVHNRSRVL